MSTNQETLAALGGITDAGLAALSAELRPARQSAIDTAITSLKAVITEQIKPPALPPAPVGRPSIAGTRPTGSLTPVANFTPESGKTYQNLQIKGGVSLKNVSHVKFINCSIDADGDSYAFNCSGSGIDLSFEHCEMKNMSSAAVYGANWTATNCYVHHSAGDGFKPTSHCTIRGCYATMLGMSDGAHADGVQIRGGNHILIDGNFFDMPTGTPGTHSNAALFLQLDTRNVTFQHNWCCGGNYTVAVYPDSKAAANVAVIGNILWGGKYGPANVFDGVRFTGNVDNKGTKITLP